MAEQLNIQFGVDASRVVRAAEQAGALAGKLFGDQFNKSAEQELQDVEVQLDLNFKGEDQAKRATKSIEALRDRLNKAAEAKKKAQVAADKMALADAKAANKKKALANAIGKVPLKAHARQLQTAINKLKTLQSQATKGSEAYKRLGTSIKGLNARLANIKGTSGPMSILGSAVKSLTGKFALANVAAGLLTDGVRALGGFVTNSLDAFTQRTKDVEALTLALQNAGVQGKEIQGVFGSIKATALTFGTSLTDVGAAWKRLAPAVLAAGGTLKDTEDVIVSMSARAVGLGLNAEQTGRYMEALAQVMGKGKLQGQELTQQLSQLDGALRGQIEQDLQNSVEGFTTLEEEMRKGAVSAEMFFDSFNRISQGAVDNLTGQMFNLTSQIKNAGDATGLTIQQIENKISTLNTMSLDKFAGVFDNFGRSLLRIQAGWAQLVFSITQSAPTLMSVLSATFSVIGKVIEITFQSLFGVIKLLTLAIEGLLLPMKGFGDLMKTLIPPDVQDKIGEIAGKLWDMNKVLFDSIMNIGNNGKKQISFLKEVDEALGNNEGNWEKLSEKLKKAIDDNILKLEAQTEALKEMYKEEKAQIQEVIEAQKEKLQEEKLIYDEIKAKANEKYNEELSKIDEIRRALDEAYGRDMKALDEKTAAERRLDAIRKEELVAKTRNLSLSEKERVAAQAQLDAMERREKKQARQLEFKKDSAKLDQQEVEAEGRKDKAIDKANKRYEERKKTIGEVIELEKKGIDEIDEEMDKLDSTIKSLKNYERSSILENRTAAIEAINAQVSQLDALITKWKAVEIAARNAANAGKGAGGGGGGNAATGGPVSAGRTYTVNEVGQEAFLSAAGKLSMIDAPSWGQWKAPSSGTVIPAHLTQQLDIPRGGIKLNGGNTPRFSSNKLMSKSGGQKSMALIRGKMGKAAKKASSFNANVKSHDNKKKDQAFTTLDSPKVETLIPPFPKFYDNEKKERISATPDSPKVEISTPSSVESYDSNKKDQISTILDLPKIKTSTPPSTEPYDNKNKDQVSVALDLPKHESKKKDQASVALDSPKHDSKKKDKVFVTLDSSKYDSKKKDKVLPTLDSPKRETKRKDKVFATLDLPKPESKKKDQVFATLDLPKHDGRKKDQTSAALDSSKRESKKKDHVFIAPDLSKHDGKNKDQVFATLDLRKYDDRNKDQALSASDSSKHNDKNKDQFFATIDSLNSNSKKNDKVFATLDSTKYDENRKDKVFATLDSTKYDSKRKDQLFAALDSSGYDSKRRDKVFATFDSAKLDDKRKDNIFATLNSSEHDNKRKDQVLVAPDSSKRDGKRRDQVFAAFDSSKPDSRSEDKVFATLDSPKIEASIPPFLSKQIDIPSTKVKSRQSSSASSVNGGSILQIARAIKGMQGGDTVSNNVTVQAVNPTRTASDMLVSLTKAKRRRYS